MDENGKMKFFSGFFIVTDPLDFDEKKIIIPAPYVKHQIRYIYDENGKLLTTTFGEGQQDLIVGENFKFDIPIGSLPDITPNVPYKVLKYIRTGPPLYMNYDTRRIGSEQYNIGLGGRKKRRSKSIRKYKSKRKNRKYRKTRRHRK